MTMQLAEVAGLKISMQTDLPPFLSPMQVAQILGVTRPTIYKRMAEGEISFMRVGRLTKIPTEALLDFIRKNGGVVEHD